MDVCDVLDPKSKLTGCQIKVNVMSTLLMTRASEKIKKVKVQKWNNGRAF